MNKMKSIYSLLSLKLSIAWLLPAIGLCFYVLVYTGLIDNYPTLGEIMIKAADVLVIGGVVGFLTNIAQTFGIFRKAIEDAFVSNDFLEKRKDISTVQYGEMLQKFYLIKNFQISVMTYSLL